MNRRACCSCNGIPSEWKISQAVSQEIFASGSSMKRGNGN